MRLPNWESKLNNYIHENQFKAFQYGLNDCCSFTIKAQKILTGSTLFPEFDGTYKDLKSGKAILNKLGYKTWIGACNDRLEKIIVPFAKRGDVVSMRTNDSFAMGICMGKYGAFIGEQKMEFIAREELKLAWRID